MTRTVTRNTFMDNYRVGNHRNRDFSPSPSVQEANGRAQPDGYVATNVFALANQALIIQVFSPS